MLRRALGIASLAALAAAAPAGAASVAETRFTVTLDKKGTIQSYQSDRFPVREGACYYWGLRIKKGTSEDFTYTEEFLLPAKPQSFDITPGNPDGTVIAEDGQSSRRTITAPLVDGWAENGWCVAAGDPLGTHVINIYEGENLLHRFEFEGVTNAEFEASVAGQ